jgi:small subunit ribosomal protein S2
MNIPSIMEMLQAGVHFGHQTFRWHPKMKEYIFTERNSVHVIDLEKTQAQLELVLPQVKEMAAQGKKILFVSTKPQAKEIVKKAAIECNMPYMVNRWMGGLLTNFPEMKRMIKKYLSIKQQKESGELERYTKKEQVKICKDLEKMEENLFGLSTLDRIPDALFIPSVHKEKTAVTEANKTNVAIIGVCDTNSNPSKVKYIIPANDDAVKAITLIVNLVTEAVKEGNIEREKRRNEEIAKK